MQCLPHVSSYWAKVVQSGNASMWKQNMHCSTSSPSLRDSFGQSRFSQRQGVAPASLRSCFLWRYYCGFNSNISYSFQGQFQFMLTEYWIVQPSKVILWRRSLSDFFAVSGENAISKWRENVDKDPNIDLSPLHSQVRGWFRIWVEQMRPHSNAQQLICCFCWCNCCHFSFNTFFVVAVMLLLFLLLLLLQN